MNTTKEFINSETAKEILKKNMCNRNISNDTVNLYARDMRAGAWQLTHQGILLGYKGVVIDGQHRLMAIVKSGIGQWMLVTRDDNFKSTIDVPVDVGNKRANAFVLGANREVVALTSFALKVGKNISMMSPADLKPYINLFNRPLQHLLQGVKNTRRGISTAPVQLAAVTRILLGDDIDYITLNYSAMLTDRFADLSPMAASFYKQIVVDRIAMDSRQVLARTVRVFDPERQATTKLQIKDEAFAFEEARKMVIDVLNMSNEGKS